jgi:[ribosomal protein S5]-alanine N-acetyltransferase
VNVLVIETPRLLLRPFRETDLADIHAYASDPDVVRLMDWGPNTLEQTRTFLVQMTSTALASSAEWCAVDMALEVKDEGRVIGSCALRRDGSACGDAALGFCLNKAYWSRGYATEAAAALLSYAFEALGAHRVYATCSPENGASARVLEKIGMQREGYLRENLEAKGRRRDSLLFAKLSTDV